MRRMPVPGSGAVETVVPRWGKGIQWIPLKIKSPTLRRGHELSVLGEPTSQQTNLSYPPISLRRNIPAIPTSPVPSRPKVPGSGTLMFVVPVWMCPIPWRNWLLLRTKMVWVVVPLTVRPSHNWPTIAPARVYVLVCPLTAVNVQVILPVKLPVKIAVLCPCAQLPLPTMLKIEPADENVPPPASVPLVIAPVVKLTEPRE